MVILALCFSFVFLVQSAAGLDCFGTICDASHSVCKVEFGHGVPTGGSCDKQHSHGNHPQCGHVLPTHGHCHCDDTFCVGLVYSFMPKMPTTPPTTQFMPPTTQAATAAPVVTTGAQTTAPVVTTGAPTAAPVVTTMGSQQATSQGGPACVDHNVKCTDSVYQQILCTATLQSTHDYAVKTCPLSCNLCNEYLDKMPHRVKKGAKTMKKWKIKRSDTMFY